MSRETVISSHMVHTADGVRLACQVSRNGPTDVIFMHGWGGSRRLFTEMLKHLNPEGLRAIAFDWRGHGDSDKPETGYSLDGFARDALAIADANRARRFVLVGYSMSGKHAQYLACVAPERVLGMILISPTPASPVPIPPEVQKEWVGMAGNREAWRPVDRGFRRRPIPPELIERNLDDFEKVPAFVLNETMNMVRMSFLDRLATVKTKTLVLSGMHDPVNTPDILRQAVVAPLAGARLVLMDCGHVTPQEMPQETAGLIDAFLAGLGIPPG